MTTIRDIARRAGVSIATVSRTFSQADAVSEPTRRRILRAAHELNYRPRAAARNLRRAARGAQELRYSIGMVFFTEAIFTEDPFGAELTARVEGALRRRGFAIRIVSCSPDGEPPAEILRGEVDGAICRGSGAVVRAIGEAVATVTLDSFNPALEVYGVVPDYRGGVRRMAADMLRAGYSDIAVAVGEPSGGELNFARQVADGCADAARETGVGRGCFRHVAAASNPRDGYALGGALLDSARPDAVIGSDGAMLGLYRAAHERGLSIPGDIAFAGVDGLSQSAYLSPPLSVVDTHLSMLAERAVDYLVGAAHRGQRRRGMELTPVRVVRRESVKWGDAPRNET